MFHKESHEITLNWLIEHNSDISSLIYDWKDWTQLRHLKFKLIEWLAIDWLFKWSQLQHLQVDFTYELMIEYNYDISTYDCWLIKHNSGTWATV